MYQEDKGDMSANLSLLQLWLGLATCCGCLLAAAATIVKSRAFFFNKRILLQFSQFGVGMPLLLCLGWYVLHMFSFLHDLPLLYQWILWLRHVCLDLWTLLWLLPLQL